MWFFNKPVDLWLIVFLGNTGPRYNGTRHNAGFMVADAVEKKLGITLDRYRFKSCTCLSKLGGQSVLLMKPQTLMNLSGVAVHEAQDYYKVPSEHILVISDDISLPVGKLRIKRDGSAGGHNGLKNIIEKCKTDNFPRIKIGVGAPPHPDYDLADWVLGTFKDQDAVDMAEAAEKAVSAIETVLTEGLDKAMNLYN